jgi:hypothetical protein
LQKLYRGGQLRQRQKLLDKNDQKDTTMKKIVMLASFATIVASPSFAQSYSSGYGTGNVLKPPAAITSNAAAAFAHEPSRSHAYDGPRYYYDRPYKHHQHSGHHQYRQWTEF